MSLFTTFLRNQSNFREKKSFCFPDLVVTKIERAAGSGKYSEAKEDRDYRIGHHKYDASYLWTQTEKIDGGNGHDLSLFLFSLSLSQRRTESESGQK